jgi:hypothetical protein
MKVSLNISERLYSLALLNEGKGNMEFLSQALEDIKQLPISEAEWKKADRKEEKTKNVKGEDTLSVRWNNERGGEKEIVFQDKVFEYIVNAIKTKDEASEITMDSTGMAMMTLYKKLKK